LNYDAETLAACGFVFAANIDDFGAGKTYPLKEGGSKRRKIKTTTYSIRNSLTHLQKEPMKRLILITYMSG
jgi:hypothetical protein